VSGYVLAVLNGLDISPEVAPWAAEAGTSCTQWYDGGCYCFEMDGNPIPLDITYP